ncbi:MAG TPA: tRNA (adenosine(37)-N6)-threonylcarbamoyltransferase complex dimerization subunit type 1 TsaB [Candidatus Acidoferrum sp.]|nr:tRNA (adenosine(37)-N6)-threonylcarbamoyltransferase complex dimerization subunit type 1 TsaB [Candidatus Acidoferrum sp.]
MYLLALDTCDVRGSIALLREGETLGESAHPATEEYSSWLIPAVNRLLSQHDLSHAELEGYAVASGPGSFTGVRVGLTTAKAWAEVYSKPIFPVSRLKVLANLAPRPSRYAAAFIDAQRKQIFAGLFQRTSRQWELLDEESVIDPTEFFERVLATAGNAPLSWLTLDPELLANSPFWRSHGNDASIVTATPPLASAIGRYAFGNLLQKGIDALALDANYVRRSDAEIFGKKAAGT